MMDSQLNLVASQSAFELKKLHTNLAYSERLAGLKIMVIDDSKTIRRSAEILLQQAGCTVILAEDGFDALDKISTQIPDLIFADVLMPRLDGYKTCAVIKRSTLYKHIPVVMLTSKDSLFDRARGRSAGSSQHLAKPFTKETLLKTVEAHIPGGHAPPRTLYS